MLTEDLIKKIEHGQAELHTYLVGGSGIGFIQVPRNHYIVITGFSFSHFIDTDLKQITSQADMETILQAALHTVQFVSKNKRYIYNFRTNINFTPISGTGHLFFTPINDAEHLDTYQKHEENINISIFKFNDIAGWQTTSSANSNESNSEAKPAGYGNALQGGESAAQEIIFVPGGAQYVPVAELSNIALGPDFRKEFRDNVDKNTRLFPPNVDIDVSKIYTFPVINIDYVIVKQL